jgi:hypothetical protein
MGKRFQAFVAFVLFGFALMNSAGPREQTELYVSSLAPLSYRAAAELPSAILMSEMSSEEYAKQQWLAKLDKPWGPPRRPIAVAGAMGMEGPAPNGQPDPNYDWRMNMKDWRFQLLSMIPFGLLFITVSLQRTKAREQAELEEECELAATSGKVPPPACQQRGFGLAMAAVDGQSPA